jgi:hypothetical protein
MEFQFCPTESYGKGCHRTLNGVVCEGSPSQVPPFQGRIGGNPPPVYGTIPDNFNRQAPVYGSPSQGNQPPYNQQRLPYGSGRPPGWVEDPRLAADGV